MLRSVQVKCDLLLKQLEGVPVDNVCTPAHCITSTQSTP